MSQFYGTVSGSAKTEATRRGNRNSGLTTWAASWAGAVRVDVWECRETERELFRVSLCPWHGSGDSVTICEGIMGSAESLMIPAALRGAVAVNPGDVESA